MKSERNHGLRIVLVPEEVVIFLSDLEGLEPGVVRHHDKQAGEECLAAVC